MSVSSLCVSLAGALPCIPVPSSSLPLVWLGWAERVSTAAQTNSFWHLQTGIRSCPCDRSRLGFRHGGSYKEACYYYFCRRRVQASPSQIPLCSGLGFFTHYLDIFDTRYQIIHQYQCEEDLLSELFSSPRWSRTGQYIWLLTLYTLRNKVPKGFFLKGWGSTQNNLFLKNPFRRKGFVKSSL